MTADSRIQSLSDWINAYLTGDDPERPSEETVKMWARRSASHEIQLFYRRHGAEVLLDTVCWVVDNEVTRSAARSDLGNSLDDAFDWAVIVDEYVTAQKYRCQRWSSDNSQ